MEIINDIIDGMAAPKKTHLFSFFDRDPQLKKMTEDYLSKLPQKKVDEDYAKFQKFVSGELTWAEIREIPPSMLKDVAGLAYHHYRHGNYEIAESLFKGLAVIDHLNWYYRSALGAIYQKQKLYDQAIEEYNMALMLNEKEITALTNRGECYLHLKDEGAALKDFEAVSELDPEGKNPWGRRAKALKEKLEVKH